MSKYYGPDKIAKEIEMGEDIKLEFENGENEIIRKKMYDYTVTDEPLDLTTLREKRIEPVVQGIMQVMLDFDIKPFAPNSEVEFILSKIKASYETNFEKADEIKWGIRVEKMKFSDIDKVLKNG